MHGAGTLRSAAAHSGDDPECRGESSVPTACLGTRGRTPALDEVGVAIRPNELRSVCVIDQGHVMAIDKPAALKAAHRREALRRGAGTIDSQVAWLPESLGRYPGAFGLWKGELTLKRRLIDVIDTLDREGVPGALARKYRFVRIEMMLGGA
jgi:hypothetical protein